MKIYVLPVSGGGFSIQLAFLKIINQSTKKLYKNGIVPDLVLGSSGGQAAAYIAMICNWNSGMFMKNLKFIKSSLFVESWTPSFFPTWIAFPLTGSFYRSGKGIRELFHKVYTPSSIVSTEIWSGTYNTYTQKSAMFCNLSSDKAILKDFEDDKYIYDSEKSIYLNGNIDDISKVVYASASIPYITPGVIIKDHVHIDGGMSFCSPVIPMKSQIIAAIKKENKREPVQIYYFSSYDMDGKFSDSFYLGSIGLLVHSMLIHDRSATLDLLRELGPITETPKIYSDVDVKKLEEIMNLYNKKSFIMMFSPKNPDSVYITSFCADDLIDIIKKNETGFKIIIYELIHIN